MCALWLVVGGGIPSAPAAPAAAAPPAGQQDPAAALGCGGCHAGVPDGGIRERAPALSPLAPDLTPEALFAYLADPRPRREPPGGARMPDFRLQEGERVALTLFLAGEPAGGDGYLEARRRHPALTSADGQRIFGALGCTGCHRHPAFPAPPSRDAPDLAQEGARVRGSWLRAYLARPTTIRPAGAPAGSFSRMPDFRLSAAEVEALARRLGAAEHPASSGPSLSAHRVRAVEASLERRLSCLGCHRLGGRGGELGPPLDGVARRLAPGYLRRVVTDPSGVLPDRSMPGAPLVESDAERLVRYLETLDGEWRPARTRSLTDAAVVEAMAAAAADLRRSRGRGADAPGGGNSPEPAAGAVRIEGARAARADAPDGAALYGRWCAGCHGSGGRGDGWNSAGLPVAPTPHAEASLMSRRPDDTLFDGIHGGAWVLDGSPAMPPFGEAFSANEIRALVAHIRRLCDCRQPAWAGDGAGPGPSGSGA